MYCSKYEMLLILDEIFDLLMDSNIECQSRLDEVLALVKKKNGIVRKADFCCGPKQVMIDTSMCGVPDKTVTINNGMNCRPGPEADWMDKIPSISDEYRSVYGLSPASANDPADVVRIKKETLRSLFGFINNLSQNLELNDQAMIAKQSFSIMRLQEIADENKGLVK